MAEGYKNFAVGAVLGETDLDDYLMSQAVMRFADASARDTALSGILTEGLVAYLKDVDTVTMYTGSAWVTAYQIGAWSTYTPTCFQEDGTAQTLTITRARYTRCGRLIVGNNHLVVSAAGSATNGEPIIVSMPVTAQDTSSSPGTPIGQGFVNDVTGSRYGVFVVNAGGAFRFWRTDTLPATWAGVDPAFALAAGDEIMFSYQYEAAS